MARRVEFEPWDASSDIVLSVYPVNNSDTFEADDSLDPLRNDKTRIVIRGATGSTACCTVTGAARMARIAEGYARQVAGGEQAGSYR